MSAATQGQKKVGFQESGPGPRKNKEKLKIETGVGANAVAMAAGPGGVDRPDVGAGSVITIPLRSRTETDEQFLTESLQKSDPRDPVMTAKLEMQTAPGITPFGLMIAKDSDFEWLRTKREAEAEANFQQWFASNFDKMSPEQKQMARELWPEFYQQRLDLLDKQINLQRRLAHLKVTGIKNKEDLLLQYAAEAGYIDQDPLEHILHPERASANQNNARRQQAFQRGLFNPKRLPRGEFGVFERNDNALSYGQTNAVNPQFLGTAGSGGFTAIGPQTGTTEKRSNFASQALALPI